MNEKIGRRKKKTRNRREKKKIGNYTVKIRIIIKKISQKMAKRNWSKQFQN